MIPSIFILISFLLGMVSGFYPYTFLGNIIFVDMFLLMNEQKIDLSLFKISTYRTFVLSFILFLGYKMLKNRDWNLKESLIAKNKKSLIPIFIYLLAIPTVSCFHYVLWKQWPTIYLHQYLKSLWPLGLLLLPINHREYFDIKRTFYYISFVLIFSLFILSPSSIYCWLNHDAAFFRIRSHWENWSYYTGIFTVDNIIHPILYLSEVASIVWVIFSGTIIFMLGGNFEKYKVNKTLYWLIISFISLILLINQSGKMILLFVFQIIVAYFMKFTSQKKVKSLIVIGSLILGCAILLTFNEGFRNKFIKEEITISKPVNDYNRRIPVLKYTLAKTIYESPWKGFGFPENFSRETILPSKLVSVAQSTNHSEGIDHIFFFGIPLGILSSVLFWLPLLLLIMTFKRLWRDANSTFTLLTLISFLSFICRFVGELGRDVYTSVIFVYFFMLVLVFLYKGEEA